MIRILKFVHEAGYYASEGRLRESPPLEFMLRPFALGAMVGLPQGGCAGWVASACNLAPLDAGGVLKTLLNTMSIALSLGLLEADLSIQHTWRASHNFPL